jgi:VIT1/CCC1 family predicted Fe2+/Mn2+ transporter
MTERARLWLENLRDEREGARLYEGLAAIEKDPARAREFAALGAGERRHAAVWERKLRGAGVELPPDTPTARTRLLLFLARRLGIRSVMPMLLAAEARDAGKYQRQGGDAAGLAPEEAEHRARLEALGGAATAAAAAPTGPGAARAKIARRERWHRTSGTGNVRAAVFGANDGLVSNLALVLGVAASGAAGDALVMTGLAGLLAGAFSMAVGEYVSVASQRDLIRRQIDIERREIAESPEEESAELAEILEHKGVPADQAEAAAAEIMKHPEEALDTLVREELGLDPEELGGSPMGAALSSFGSFTAGALVPLVPLLVLSGSAAAWGAGILGGVVLGAIGAFLGVLSGTGALRSGARMVALAALAAGATMAVGHLVGAQL